MHLRRYTRAIAPLATFVTVLSGFAAAYAAEIPQAAAPLPLFPAPPAGASPAKLPTVTPLRSLLTTLFQDAHVPFIIGPGVEGNVTFSLDTPSLDDALGTITAACASPRIGWTKTTSGVYIVRVAEPPRIEGRSETEDLAQSVHALALATSLRSAPAGTDPIELALRLQIIELRVERKTLSATAGPSNPALVTLETRLRAYEGELQSRRIEEAARKSGAPDRVTGTPASRKRPGTPVPPKRSPARKG